MNRTLKIFLLWLLVAVLPVQGVAAATRACCAPIHQSSSSASDTQSHHHDASEGHGHHHHDGMQHDSNDTASHDDSVAAGKSLDSNHDHKTSCSACAACCLFAVVPPTMPFSEPVYNNSESIAVLPEPLIASFISGGLERPPKHISA